MVQPNKSGVLGHFRITGFYKIVLQMGFEISILLEA